LKEEDWHFLRQCNKIFIWSNENKDFKKENNMPKRIRAGTPAGYRAGLSGQKIRSSGRGRGLGRGRGKGPVGRPYTKRK